jgi:hypothetical protein
MDLDIFSPNKMVCSTVIPLNLSQNALNNLQTSHGLEISRINSNNFYISRGDPCTSGQAYYEKNTAAGK